MAARQHGVISLGQLRAIGLGASTVRHRVAAAQLFRLHRGVFAVGSPGVGRHGHWLAAVLACGPGAVLSHRSAAALSRIRESAAGTIDVTSPGRAGRRRPGILVHSGDTLVDAEITTVAGIPCTTVARTLLDLAGVLRPDALEYAIHRAQTKGLFDRDELRSSIMRSPTRRGTAALRRILQLSLPQEDGLKSELERRFLRLCRAAGLPAPRPNVWIALPEGHGFEVDFVWPDRKLIVETDSRGYHATDRAFENDPHRDRLLTLAGWTVIRFTYRDLTERPRVVARQLTRLLAARAIR